MASEQKDAYLDFSKVVHMSRYILLALFCISLPSLALEAAPQLFVITLHSPARLEQKRCGRGSWRYRETGPSNELKKS